MTTTQVSTKISKLKINKLTQTQFDNASEYSNSELYFVDPEFTGNNVIMTNDDGDIQEGYTITSISDGDTVEVVNNTIYNAGTIATLNITLPATPDNSFIAELDFTNNATTPAVITPSATVKWCGDDCDEDFEFHPLVGYRYTVMLTYNGVNYVATVRGTK